MFCVADGMGGVQGGEVASKAVVDALRKAFEQSPDAAYAVTADAAAKLFERALNEASHWIKERADSLGIHGTGSTAVGLVFDRVMPSQGIVLHAGDSRAYRLRDDKLIQLTTDHSVAAAAGLPDDSALPPMFRGVITRAVGLERNVVLEATPFDVLPNDVFLLCSDGLDKMVSDRRIQKIIRKHHYGLLDQMAQSLVEEALLEGGDDNVTVIVVRIAKDLPSGPTMEVPPETHALEKLVLDPHDPNPPLFRDEQDETGETANMAGGQTGITLPEADVGAAGHKAELARGWDRAPDTPVRPKAGIKRTVSESSGSMLWFWVLLLLVMVVAAGAYLALKIRTLTPSPEITPFGMTAGGATNSVGLPVESGFPASPAAGEEPNDGMRE
jgi:protein phosphatase